MDICLTLMDFSVIISNEKLIQGPRKKIHISQQQSMLIDDQQASQFTRHSHMGWNKTFCNFSLLFSMNMDMYICETRKFVQNVHCTSFCWDAVVVVVTNRDWAAIQNIELTCIYRRVRLYRHHTADCITVVHTNVLLNIQTTIIIENIPMVCPPPVMVVRALASNLRTGQMQLQYTHKPVGWQTRRVI